MIYDYYIAHPFESRQKTRKWQLKIEKKLNIKCFNAFYPVRFFEVYNKDDKSNKKYYKKIKNKYKQIVEEDIDYIKKSKAVIVIIDGKISYGTIQEMVYAKLNNKKVYSIITNKQELHPWLVYHSDKIFTKYKHLEKYLIKCHI